MKISKIIIPNFQQFRNFQLDLTYPQNHKKAGQPLDKVCFIGRNATGKTTLLELIRESFLDDYNKEGSRDDRWFIFKLEDSINSIWQFWGKYVKGNVLNYDKLFLDPKIEEDDILGLLNKTNHDVFGKLEEILKYEIANNADNFYTIKLFKDKLNLYNPKNILIYAPCESENNELLSIKGVPETNLNNALNKNKQNRYPVVSNESIKDFWEQLIFLEKKRDNDFKEYLQQNKDRVYSEVEKEFNSKSPTILKEISVLWDKILDKAGLFFDYENAKNPIQLTDNLLAYIKLISTKETIPYNKLSAGIRNFIFRLGHIYSLYFNRKIENGFLLIDEPENSLYPDFLYDLIETYESIIHNTQFFVATHNPIIAAQFDPSERIYLDFDDKGYVVSRKGITPEGDDPNDILEKDFLIRSLLGKPALEKWERFLELKTLIKETKEKEEKHKYMAEYLEIGNSYNFPLQ